MACLGVRTGGGVSLRANRVGDQVKFPGLDRVRVGPTKASSQAKSTVLRCSAIEVAPRGGGGGGTHVSGGSEKFDRWMESSVGEIVKNLREAPLFVHVYGGDSGSGGPGSGPMLRTERAVEEEWAQLKSKWGKGEEPSPEGIILVEELKEGGDVEIMEEDEGRDGDSTKRWGVLIQGKGEEGGVGCYLLKTSKVGCGNLGVFCTHYCLVKVKSFRETARSQLTSCWLV